MQTIQLQSLTFPSYSIFKLIQTEEDEFALFLRTNPSISLACFASPATVCSVLVLILEIPAVRTSFGLSYILIFLQGVVTEMRRRIILSGSVTRGNPFDKYSSSANIIDRQHQFKLARVILCCSVQQQYQANPLHAVCIQ